MKFSNEDHKSAYTGLRTDILSAIKGSPRTVLDVGCSNGVLLRYFKYHCCLDFAAGIEIDCELANEACDNADMVLRRDLDSFNIADLNGKVFDLIVLADVLEHTKNPKAVLRQVLQAASNDAQVIISVPNVQHWTVIKNLLIGVWPERNRGIFDRTHLRFFTLDSIYRLLEDTDFLIDIVSRNYRVADASGSSLNRFSRLFAFWPLKPFFTYQYVVRLHRASRKPS